MDPAKIRDLENRLRYTFNDKGLLIRALTHSTFFECGNPEKGVKTPLNKFDCVTNGGRA